VSSRAGNEAGQAGIVLLMAILALLAVAGLAIDGGELVTAKIGLQADADAAARTGAGAVDQAAFLTGQGAVLDPAAAEASARAALATTCSDCTVSVSATRDGVTVTLRRRQPTFLLGVVGLRSVDVAASSRSSPVTR
jgi:Flp pilus assembly protein TadG